ncbi:MAG TPA: radical SAM protein [Thermoanaerobaculia bacterium]
MNSIPAHELRRDIPGRFNEIDVIRREWLRFLAVLEGQIVPPYEVLVHPSSTCNLRCEWCIGDYVPIEEAATGRVLDAAKTCGERLPDTLAQPAKMRRLIEGILAYRERVTVMAEDGPVETELGIDAVSFSGLIGEPLLSRRAVLEAIAMLRAAGVRTGLYTNGIAMDAEVREALLGIDYVHISVDAGTPETFARVKCGGSRRGPALFERMMENIAALAALRARTPGAAVAINASYVVTAVSYEELYEAARRLRDAGVDSLRVKQDNAERLRLDARQRAETHAAFDRIEAELAGPSFRLVRIHAIDDVPYARYFSTCTITELMAAAGSDGHLYPCNYHPRPNGASYGSAVERPFEEIWKGGARRTLREQLPAICPSQCDPFKTRANTLLADLRGEGARAGLAGMTARRDALLAQFA